MKNGRGKFPYWIHTLLGIIWIVVGVVFYSSIELAIWVGGGLVMLIIGFLNKGK